MNENIDWEKLRNMLGKLKIAEESLETKDLNLGYFEFGIDLNLNMFARLDGEYTPTMLRAMADAIEFVKVE